jgi:glycosyltransferase involved in cell wall biosynthesis
MSETEPQAVAGSGAAEAPALTVIIPAFNEATIIAATLAEVRLAAARVDGAVETIVIDNRSTDATATLAQAAGVKVVAEQRTGIAYARNAGGLAAAGQTLVFIDADTDFPADALARVAALMADPRCAGGAPRSHYAPAQRWTVRAYLGLWHQLGRALKMTQGGFQFCRAGVFRAIGGYDTSQYMGEDVDFMWRLRRYARARGMTVCAPAAFEVTQSVRRFDQWPLWRMLVWSDPMFIQLLRRRRSVWRGWYEEPPRGA